MSAATDRRRCPSCGHPNPPGTARCALCRASLVPGSTLVQLWGRVSRSPRANQIAGLLAGAGCLLAFVFLPLGALLLFAAYAIRATRGKALSGICPHCGRETFWARRKGAAQEFPCLHCRGMIAVDTRSDPPRFEKAAREAGEPEGAADTDGQPADATPPAEVAEIPAGAAGPAPAGSRKAGRPALLALGLLLVGFGIPYLAGLPAVRAWWAARQQATAPEVEPPEPADAEAAGPGERILSFHGHVAVLPDGALRVRETIRVRAEGRSIRRGIYRDFPTRYHWEGRAYDVGFAVAGVERDGRPEAWHQERRGNGVRVYMGRKDRLVPRGVHTYVLTYLTDRQLGRFEEHDELYWNVTGNGWEFPIDHASCTVTLPPGVPSGTVQTVGFTGPAGSTERAVERSLREDGTARFIATRPLGAREGLTVAVKWPKGFVGEPSLASRARRFLDVDERVNTGLAGLAALLVFYLVSWVRVGRDPERGVVVPLYEPPRGLSAAAVRYLREMGFDNRVFTAAVIEMASRGYLALREEGNTLVLEVQPGADLSALTARLRRVARTLFPAGKGSLELKSTNHSRIGGALRALKDSLAREHLAKAFHDNRAYFGWGVVITFVSVAAVILRVGVSGSGGILVWLAIWTAAAVFLWVQRVWAFAVIWTATDILVVVLVAGRELPWQSLVLFLGVVLALAGLNVLFYHLLKAPTRLGRRLMDEIEGFRNYLATAEGDRLNRMHPPERTPQLFERYLPYALALGVEQEWAEQFSGVLAQAGTAPASGGYRPTWYHGTRWSSGSLASLSDGIGSSLTSAISSSSQPPGSRSGGGGGGFGGGGSSGGGGGGGGGGGW